MVDLILVMVFAVGTTFVAVYCAAMRKLLSLDAAIGGSVRLGHI